MDRPGLERLLIKHEGLRLESYLDTTGNLTIGVGHNLTAKPIIGLTSPITLDQAMSILEDDIDDTYRFVQQNLLWCFDLDDVRLNVIFDMAFNLQHKLLGFHYMLRAMQEGDWYRASKELMSSLFAQQTGQRAKDLSEMLLSGQYPTS